MLAEIVNEWHKLDPNNTQLKDRVEYYRWHTNESLRKKCPREFAWGVADVAKKQANKKVRQPASSTAE